MAVQITGIDNTPLPLLGNMVVDMRDFPVEKVAHAATFFDPRFDPELRHPDLWHDGRWSE